MTYSEKIKDPRWQKKRLEIFNRDNWTCQICGDKESTLHIHHYDYSGDPWEIENDYLKTLCENCHQYEHEYLNYARSSLEEQTKKLTSDCLFQLWGTIYKISNHKDVNKILNHIMNYIHRLESNSFKECENDIKVIKLYEDK